MQLAEGWEQEWWQLLPQETAALLAISGYSGSSRGQRERPGPAQCGGGGDVGRYVACWGRLAAACGRKSRWSLEQAREGYSIKGKDRGDMKGNRPKRRSPGGKLIV